MLIDYLKAIFISYFFFILIESPVYHLIKIITGSKPKPIESNNFIEENNRSVNRKCSESIEIKLFSNNK